MHVWTLPQHTMIVYVLRISTVPQGYVTSVLFVNKVVTLFTYDNWSEKGTEVNENEHMCPPYCKHGNESFLSLFPTPNRGP